jgi:hypothetical protein
MLIYEVIRCAGEDSAFWRLAPKGQTALWRVAKLSGKRTRTCNPLVSPTSYVETTASALWIWQGLTGDNPNQAINSLFVEQFPKRTQSGLWTNSTLTT